MKVPASEVPDAALFVQVEPTIWMSARTYSSWEGAEKLLHRVRHESPRNNVLYRIVRNYYDQFQVRASWVGGNK